MADFSQLGLAPPLQQAANAAGYSEMTPIQAASLPLILAGTDIIAQAKTGSGKTAAFALGLISKLDVAQSTVQSLVLCPTRELAEQVTREIRQLARLVPNVKVLTVCGGTPVRLHIESLRRPPHVVVGTPGRLVDLLARGAIDFSALTTLVLDEADRMLDMGFSDDINEITSAVPGQRQTLLFSATYSPTVRDLSKRYQRDPMSISVDSVVSDHQIRQHFYAVEEDDKFDLLERLLASNPVQAALVFCKTKRQCQTVAKQLLERGHSALALNGDLEQRERDDVMVQFSNQSCAVLVATDVAARGLDIKELPLVINYDLANDPDVHLHRIGRTGRAGGKGLAISFCTKRERQRVASTIEAKLGTELKWRKPPPRESSIERLSAEMITVLIEGGRKHKLRPGDVLGALTGAGGLPGDAIGKIDVYPTRTYVAVHRASARDALKALQSGRIKGSRFRATRLG